MKETFKAGQMYTALSGVKIKKGFYILGAFQSSKITSAPKTVKGMARMAPPDSFFKLSVLNINSLSSLPVPFSGSVHQQ